MPAKKRSVHGLLTIALDAAIARPSSAADVEPKWNKLFAFGTFKRSDFPNGVLVFDRAFLSTMVENWVKGGKRPKPVDSLHRGDSGEDGLPAEEKAARGWIEDLQLRDDGLWGLVKWNAKGLGFILADEYRYLSPSFHPDWVDNHTGKRQGPTLFGAGLVNNPFLEELPRVAADVVGDQPEENTVNKKLLCARLGLAETATDAEINAALEKPESDVVKLAAEKVSKDAAEKVRLANAAKENAEAEVVKLADRVKALEEDTKVANERRLKVETVQLCDKLQSEGRITANEKVDVEEDVKTFGLEKASARWSKRPVVVALGARGIDSKNTDEVTPDQAHIQLAAKAEELVKAGVPRGEATERAMAQNPKLALSAAKLTTEHAPKALA